MDWPQIFGLIASGGVLTKLVDVMVQGWRDQAAARGRREDERERLMQSRLAWMSEYHRMRRLAYDLGATPGQVADPPDDPYTDQT